MSKVKRRLRSGDLVVMSEKGKDSFDHGTRDPHDLEGEVTNVGKIKRIDAYPIRVKWSNGRFNCYREEHLELVKPKTLKEEFWQFGYVCTNRNGRKFYMTPVALVPAHGDSSLTTGELQYDDNLCSRVTGLRDIMEVRNEKGVVVWERDPSVSVTVSLKQSEVELLKEVLSEKGLGQVVEE